MRQGMVLGAIWSMASVGWIAAIALISMWVDSGFVSALFWFGLVLLFGAAVFGPALVITLLCELFNITTKQSRRAALTYFSWALFYNLVLGGISLAIAMQFDPPQKESNTPKSSASSSPDSAKAGGTNASHTP
jgi:hypothetical protein